MNKGRVLGYYLGWTKNKLHNLKTSALPNSSFHRNLERNAAASLSLVRMRNYSAATNMCIKCFPEPELLDLKLGFGSDQYGEALSRASKALEYLDRGDAKPNLALARCLQLLGSGYCRLQRYEDGIGYLNRASEVLGRLEEECSADDMKPILHAIHSDTFIVKKEEGIRNARKVLETMDCEGSTLGDANRDVAEAYLGALNFKEARHYCLKALEMHSKDPLEMARDKRLLDVIESGYELDRKAPPPERMFVGLATYLRYEIGFAAQEIVKESNRGHPRKDDKDMIYGPCGMLLASMARSVLEHPDTHQNHVLGESQRHGYSIGMDILSKHQLCGADLLRANLIKIKKNDEDMIYAMIFVAMARKLLWHGELKHVLGELNHVFGESQRWLALAMDILSKNQVTWDMAVADAYVEMSTLYQAMNEYETAFSLLQKAKRMVEKIPGLAKMRGNCFGLSVPEQIVVELDARMGWLLFLAGKFESAAASLEKAIERMKQCFGAEDIKLGYAYNNLGAAYMELHKVPSAARALERAQHIITKCCGSHHRDSIESCRNLSKAYAAMEDYKAALKFQQEVIMAIDKFERKKYFDFSTDDIPLDSETVWLYELFRKRDAMRDRVVNDGETLILKGPPDNLYECGSEMIPEIQSKVYILGEEDEQQFEKLERNEPLIGAHIKALPIFWGRREDYFFEVVMYEKTLKTRASRDQSHS